jgi:hypothetical protein
MSKQSLGFILRFPKNARDAGVYRQYTSAHDVMLTFFNPKLKDGDELDTILTLIGSQLSQDLVNLVRPKYSSQLSP